jgi:hypothetical protein
MSTKNNNNALRMSSSCSDDQ